MCPCQFGRSGAFTLTACIYGACALGGLPAMLAALHAGNIIAIGWAVAVFFGAGWLMIAVGEALSHSDPFVPQSVLWSVGVIGLAGYALRHGWYFSGNALLFHLSRAAWHGWIASEVFNIWLNLRGIGRHRRVTPVSDPMPETTTRLRRRRSIELVEEIEGRGVEAGDFVRHLGVDSHAGTFPAAAGQDQPAPQVVHVKDETGNFVPLQLPKATLNRRLSR
jgi:hypothetical protein